MLHLCPMGSAWCRLHVFSTRNEDWIKKASLRSHSHQDTRTYLLDLCGQGVILFFLKRAISSLSVNSGMSVSDNYICNCREGCFDLPGRKIRSINETEWKLMQVQRSLKVIDMPLPRERYSWVS
jgi:hypothetical protein